MVLALSLNTAVFANDELSGTTNESNEVSQFFIDYIDHAFNNLDLLFVKDANGDFITQNFINDTAVLYSNGDYQGIRDIIQDKNLSVSYQEIQDLKKMTNSGIQPLAVSGENVSEHFLHRTTDTKGKFTKEWVTTVSGSFSYGGNYAITWVSDATVSFKAPDIGTSFVASMTNTSTSSSYSGFKATFSASYKMEMIHSIGWLTETLDFGNYTDTFSAYPSPMQN